MMQITWLGHSAFVWKLPSQETVLFDPWLEGNPKYPGTKIDKCDAILLSHGHSDHLGSTVELAKKFQAKVVCIYELAEFLASKGVEAAVGLNKGGTVDLGFARVTLTHAFHSSSFSDAGTQVYLGEACGFAIETGGKRIYFAGDTEVFGDMALIAQLHGPIDVAFLPIGDRYTMGPASAAHACRLLRPKKVVPMHWGTFPLLTGTPDDFRRRIADIADLQVVDLEPGKTIEI